MKRSWLLGAVLTLPLLSACGQKAYTRTTAVTPAPVESGPFLAARSFDVQCGAQTPVWADQSRMLYYDKGTPQYGRTANGGYICRRDALAAGYRSAKK